MSSTTLTTARPATAASRRSAVAPPLPRSSHAELRDGLAVHRGAASLAEAVAAHRDLWARGVRFDPVVARQEVVWTDDSWEVVVGTWLPGQTSPTAARLHRPGVLHVLQGELEETTWVTATDGPEPGRRHAVVRRYAVGSTRSHGSVHVHDLRNPGPDPAVALLVHAVADGVRRPS